MGFYSNFIFPWCLDWSMSSPIISKYRKEILADVSGEVLEIGFGTGLNLAYYPETVQKITTVDPNLGVNKLAQKRINQSEMSVDNLPLSGENLPMKDRSFDSVVSTWTLCSIADIDRAISEIHRVLKPGGKFFFIEHGLSNETPIQVWQNRLNPIQNIIGDGCNLNRNIETIIAKKFDNLTVKQFYEPKYLKVLGYMYQGVAIK
ncbi:Methyltransferase type 11 [Stanieria sp. NIES-3757]|nr:Methyltransferase type 11 [Stanieria sp. NIES-3757]